MDQKSMISQLQKHLNVIRRIAGWTTEELGAKIGVTKQTISNLENNKTQMTLTQYLAIRVILDYEIQSNPDNTLLAQVVDILLNQEDASEEDMHKIEVLSAATLGGASAGAIASTLGFIMGGPIAAASASVGVALWVGKLLEKNSKNKKTKKDNNKNNTKNKDKE